VNLTATVAFWSMKLCCLVSGPHVWHHKPGVAATSGMIEQDNKQQTVDQEWHIHDSQPDTHKYEIISSLSTIELCNCGFSDVFAVFMMLNFGVSSIHRDTHMLRTSWESHHGLILIQMRRGPTLSYSLQWPKWKQM
jgi:hypothetical protein